MRDNPHYAAAAIAYKAALKAKPTTQGELRALLGSDLTTYQELQQRAAADFLPGLGTFGLLVLADLTENAGTDRKSIAERCGLKISAVATALRKLTRLGAGGRLPGRTFWSIKPL
jgi:hypothetical protein